VKPTTVVPATKKPVDFGKSIADRVKNAWKDELIQDTSVSNKGDKSSTDYSNVQLAKVPSDLSLPSLPVLPDFDLPQIDFTSSSNTLPKVSKAVPGMRTGGVVSSDDNWYLADVKGKLNALWLRPATILANEESCELAFRILPDGEIREMSISTASGNQAFDDSVLTALKRVGRFEPLPESIGTKAGEIFYLTFVLSR
jgi:TonB family protein